MPVLSSFAGASARAFRSVGKSANYTAGYNYIGDGSLGDVTISANTNITVPNKNGAYDGDYVVLNYKSLTINAGATLTTDQPCRGLLIYVQGNCVINGTLSMKQRGAAADPTVTGASDASATSANGIQYVVFAVGATGTLVMANGDPFAGCGLSARNAVKMQPGANGNGRVLTIARAGANGGLGQTYVPGNNPAGNPGANATANQTGGGAAGGGYDATAGSSTSGNGAPGSCFSGGPGGGAVQSNIGGGHADNAAPNGGIGGNGDATAEIGTGYGRYAGGGVGNPHGRTEDANTDVTSTQPSENGTGGIIWLIVGGNLTINAGGVITAEGARGHASGGSSGGGAIKLLYKGTYTNSGTVTANGGDASLGGVVGGNGSIETVAML